MTPPGLDTNPSQVSFQKTLVLIFLPRKDGKLSSLLRKRKSHQYLKFGRAGDRTGDLVFGKEKCYQLHLLCDCNLTVFFGFLGWDDGKIRAFTPQTGKPMYTINDSHNKGVTAIATTSDSTRIVSGGGEGEVRVWQLPNVHTYIGSMKEHKGINIVSC